MERGLYTFAGTGADPSSGAAIQFATRLSNLLEEAVLADKVGLDVFGIGEHHRPDFAISTLSGTTP